MLRSTFRLKNSWLGKRFDYPLYMMMFLSKANNLNNFLMKRTILRVFANLEDSHHVHKIFGVVVGIESTSHTFFHLLRWGESNEMSLLWTTRTGLTGIVIFVTGLFIIIPMSVPFVKSRINFEMRKAMHWLFLVWALALANHGPQWRTKVLIGVAFTIYMLDLIFGLLNRTHLCENALFERLSDSSCLLTFKNPPGETAYPSQRLDFT